MNWINLEDLKIRLSENLVSEREAFQYLLANWLLFGMIAFGAVDQNYNNPGVMLMLLVIPSIGLAVGYFANKRGDGQDFLKRFIAVHWVLGLRFLVLLIAGLFLLSFIISDINSEALKGWITGGYCLLIGFSFYFSIGNAMKKVADMYK